MTTVFGGSGDPKRTIELLWGVPDRPRRGPKPKLRVDEIADAAIGIADTEGLPAVSMRRLAEQFGVTAMSLYSYVPSKAELIDLMTDRVYGEFGMPEDLPGGWRARLEHVAREAWALHLRHSWLLAVAVSRPVPGPHLIAKYDYELRAVAGTGLAEVEMDLVASLVTDYVQGAARSAVAATQAQAHTGKTDQEWWSEYGPLLAEVFDAERYPTAAAVGAAAGEELDAAYNPARAFEFGLQRVLDGVAALIADRS